MEDTPQNRHPNKLIPHLLFDNGGIMWLITIKIGLME